MPSALMPTTAPFVLEETRLMAVVAVNQRGPFGLAVLDQLTGQQVPVNGVTVWKDQDALVLALAAVGLTVHQDGHVFRARGEA